jgi:hypothetical protein
MQMVSRMVSRRKSTRHSNQPPAFAQARAHQRHSRQPIPQAHSPQFGISTGKALSVVGTVAGALLLLGSQFPGGKASSSKLDSAKNIETECGDRLDLMFHGNPWAVDTKSQPRLCAEALSKRPDMQADVLNNLFLKIRALVQQELDKRQ